jgi:hypothetical protein
MKASLIILYAVTHADNQELVGNGMSGHYGQLKKKTAFLTGTYHASNFGREISAQYSPSIFPLLEPNQHYSLNGHHIGNSHERRSGNH